MKKRVRITQEIFMDRCLREHKGSNLEFHKSVFTKSNEFVTYTCRVHGDKSMRARHLMRGTGCPECALEKQTSDKYLTTEEFIDKAGEIHPTLSFEGVEYKNSKTIVELRCDKGHTFSAIPNNVLNGRGCPRCSAIQSKAEASLAKFIQSLGEDIELNNREIIFPQELDIVIPKHHVAIEFNGLFWHNDKNVDNRYHLNKTLKCSEKGYRLIHIFEDEWNDKKEIVKSRVKNILGKTKERVYGRETRVREVPHKEAKEFLLKNHIQGNVNSKVRLGLFKSEEMVSLMTFGSLRKSLGRDSIEGHYELLRFCNKLDTSVIGGASKLLKHFERVYQPRKVISYADYRWSNGELYNNMGFTFEGRSIPNYYYLPKRSDQRLSRFQFRKSELIRMGYDTNKTERQIMEEKGFSRIYDCGALRYKKSYTK